MKSEIK